MRQLSEPPWIAILMIPRKLPSNFSRHVRPCLGLLGLIAIVVERRTKEIGIRKVMGATTSNIIYLLSSDFTKLIGISFLLASPVAYFMMQDWLKDFEYRISLDPFTFVLAGAAALFIALLTISIQTIRTALANQMNSLRNE